MARLKEIYNNKIQSDLTEKLGIKNKMAIPRIEKVIVNVGVGRAIADSKKIEEVEDILAKITGQKPIRTKAKKSIAGFKLRAGMPVGVTVTLRGSMMYEFLDRLINTALPRVRDFRGVSDTAFDGKGNYSLGIKEHTIFPEMIGRDDAPISLQINVQTSTEDNAKAKQLLRDFGFPFKANN